MVNFPDDSKRITIVGRTGSGKTQAGIWHLSTRSYPVRPWVVYDFKADSLINEIPGARHIDVSEVPKHPGVYITHPHPDQLEDVQAQMWRIWEQENIGIYIDEGYMVCGSGTNPNRAYRSILTQGRSKQVPVIALSQRPVWMDRFQFSESEFFQVFALSDKRDRQTVKAFVPADLDARLPEYHSYYHDVGADQTVVMKPVPKKNDILSIFDRRMTKRRTFV